MREREESDPEICHAAAEQCRYVVRHGAMNLNCRLTVGHSGVHEHVGIEKDKKDLPLAEWVLLDSLAGESPVA